MHILKKDITINPMFVPRAARSAAPQIHHTEFVRNKELGYHSYVSYDAAGNVLFSTHHAICPQPNRALRCHLRAVASMMYFIDPAPRYTWRWLVNDMRAAWRYRSLLRWFVRHLLPWRTMGYTPATPRRPFPAHLPPRPPQW